MIDASNALEIVSPHYQKKKNLKIKKRKKNKIKANWVISVVNILNSIFKRSQDSFFFYSFADHLVTKQGLI